MLITIILFALLIVFAYVVLPNIMFGLVHTISVLFCTILGIIGKCMLLLIVVNIVCWTIEAIKISIKKVMGN